MLAVMMVVFAMMLAAGVLGLPGLRGGRQQRGKGKDCHRHNHDQFFHISYRLWFACVDAGG
jgi:hypothetical protein